MPPKALRCRDLEALWRRIAGGERPRLVDRTYRAADGGEFRAIEPEDEPGFRARGYTETDAVAFLSFLGAKQELRRLARELGCDIGG